MILAGVSIATTTGENGLISRAQLAKEKTDEITEDENEKLSSYENEIDNYMTGTSRDTVTLTTDQYNSIMNRLTALENKTTSTNTVELWTGSSSSGTLTLNDSIYNYNYLVFSIALEGCSAIVTVNKDGMSTISSGGGYALLNGNQGRFWGFYISSISPDGKTLTLARCGHSSADEDWLGTDNIVSIKGI